MCGEYSSSVGLRCAHRVAGIQAIIVLRTYAQPTDNNSIFRDYAARSVTEKGLSKQKEKEYYEP